MRGVAYALMTSLALVLGAMTQASAGCYGECNGYQDNRGYGPPPAVGYDRPYNGDAGYYDAGPRGHTVYYERGPEYFVGGYERPMYRSAYVADYNGDGYADAADVSGYGGGGYGVGGTGPARGAAD